MSKLKINFIYAIFVQRYLIHFHTYECFNQQDHIVLYNNTKYQNFTLTLSEFLDGFMKCSELKCVWAEKCKSSVGPMREAGESGSTLVQCCA